MNILDSFIGFFAPESGIRRAQARATLSQINQLGGSPKGPYAAASKHRLNHQRPLMMKENEVDPIRLQWLRTDAWDLYRDNPSARKIIRSLQAKVIGRGMVPESQAMNSDGSPNVEFRAKAKQLWSQIQSGFDARGLPGRGGLTFAGMQKLALKSAILSGDMLYRLRPITEAKRREHDLPINIALQLIDSSRLAGDSEIPATQLASGHTLFRGIEYNADSERVAYWIKTVPIATSAMSPTKVTRVPKNEIGHLFVEEDIDGEGGVTWLAAAILQMRDTADLQYNVLVGSKMASCVVATYSKPTGANKLGLNQGSNSDATDLTDTDGNAVTKIQPGLIANVGKDGSFNLQSPNQPNMNPEAFVQHLQRGIATALPGVKSSTITGDYRQSSFSSERSADNDIWPEVQDIQEWFASSFCQPIYEAVLRAGVMSGFFNGIVSPEEFQSSPGRYSAATWQGPVALSINPKDDAEAASRRIQYGLSSMQMECAKNNVNWRDVLNDHAELYAVAEAKGIPDEVVNNILGVNTEDQLAIEAASTEPAEDENQQTETQVVNA